MCDPWSKWPVLGQSFSLWLDSFRHSLSYVLRQCVHYLNPATLVRPRKDESNDFDDYDDGARVLVDIDGGSEYDLCLRLTEKGGSSLEWRKVSDDNRLG